MIEDLEQSLEHEFIWTDERVAEVSRLIYDKKRMSDVWTSDYTAELNIIKDFKLTEFVKYKIAKATYTEIEEEDKIIMDRNKFFQLIGDIVDYMKK